MLTNTTLTVLRWHLLPLHLLWAKTSVFSPLALIVLPLSFRDPNIKIAFLYIYRIISLLPGSSSTKKCVQSAVRANSPRAGKTRHPALLLINEMGPMDVGNMEGSSTLFIYLYNPHYNDTKLVGNLYSTSLRITKEPIRNGGGIESHKNCDSFLPQFLYFV